MSTLLRLDGIQVGYGDMTAVHEASLEVREGETVALIGGNGAGKTTTLRAVSGLLPLRRGSIAFAGERLDGVGPAGVVARGIAHVPEGRQLFPLMTVAENLELGGYLVARAERARRLARAFEFFPRLAERRRQLAGTMSGGEQQMLAVGRALMGTPRLLMLDEPSLGLAPRMVDELFSIVLRIRAEGTTVLLVEQNVARALAIAEYAYVFERGRVALHGRASEVLASDHLRTAYLGGHAVIKLQ